MKVQYLGFAMRCAVRERRRWTSCSNAVRGVILKIGELSLWLQRAAHESCRKFFKKKPRPARIINNVMAMMDVQKLFLGSPQGLFFFFFFDFFFLEQQEGGDTETLHKKADGHIV